MMPLNRSYINILHLTFQILLYTTLFIIFKIILGGVKKIIFTPADYYSSFECLDPDSRI